MHCHFITYTLDFTQIAAIQHLQADSPTLPRSPPS